MIVLTLTRTVNHIIREQTWEIEGGVPGVAIARDLLESLVTSQEFATLPNGNAFSATMHGGELRADYGSDVPLTVDEVAVVALQPRPFKDRGVLTLAGLIFVYEVKYV